MSRVVCYVMLYIGTFIFRPRFSIHVKGLLDYQEGAVALGCSLQRSWHMVPQNMTLCCSSGVVTLQHP